MEAIIAIAENGAFGLEGGMPWHVPSDLKKFREITMGRTLVCGRKTAETLPKLPGRDLLVLSRKTRNGGGFVYCADPRDIHKTVSDRKLAGRPILIGGADTIRLCMPLVTKIHLTVVQAEPDADVYMQEFLHEVGSEPWQMTAVKAPSDPRDQFRTKHFVVQRVPSNVRLTML